MTAIHNLTPKWPETQFLDAEQSAALISQAGVAHCIEQIANYIEQDFRRWPDFEKIPRVANHSKDGVIELMPVSDAELYAFKYVNGHPRNFFHHLPTVMAFGVLADVASGFPLLISELTLTTALRTAAMSALAAKYLARRDSQRMAVIGNGAQSEFQIIAFHHLLGIREFCLFDIDPLATDKLIRNLTHLGLSFKRFASCAAAVARCDIVTTVTADKAYATIFTAAMMEPGMHINAVGGDCPGKTELDANVLKRASIFVEYAPQTRIEGDIQKLSPDHPVTELWEVMVGKATGRPAHTSVTVFDSVGFALEDYSALRFMRDLARTHSTKKTISLIPQLVDPKDLFSFIPPAPTTPTSAEPKTSQSICS